MTFCPSCGNETKENTKFCVVCGAEISDHDDDGVSVKDNVVQRSQVGAASVGNIQISPIIAPSFNVERKDSHFNRSLKIKFVIISLLLIILISGVLIWIFLPTTIYFDPSSNPTSLINPSNQSEDSSNTSFEKVAEDRYENLAEIANNGSVHDTSIMGESLTDNVTIHDSSTFTNESVNLNVSVSGNMSDGPGGIFLTTVW
jgi:cytoskeletal protein RodZ